MNISEPTMFLVVKETTNTKYKKKRTKRTTLTKQVMLSVCLMIKFNYLYSISTPNYKNVRSHDFSFFKCYFFK